MTNWRTVSSVWVVAHSSAFWLSHSQEIVLWCRPGCSGSPQCDHCMSHTNTHTHNTHKHTDTQTHTITMCKYLSLYATTKLMCIYNYKHDQWYYWVLGYIILYLIVGVECTLVNCHSERYWVCSVTVSILKFHAAPASVIRQCDYASGGR